MQPARVISGADPQYVFEATNKLSSNFGAFFTKLNPSPTCRQKAASQYGSLKALLESKTDFRLGVECRTQGSYDRHTAIHSINDIDIVAVCTNLFYPPEPSVWPIPTEAGWTRDLIFREFERVLRNDGRYSNSLIPAKQSSMCVKLNLGINVEILPVVKVRGASLTEEPFFLWRPSRNRWEPGYAQEHQDKLSDKNKPACRVIMLVGPPEPLGTDGNLIPAIKVFKHLCAVHKVEAVSFHLECLLYALPDELFWGPPSSYIYQLLSHIASRDPSQMYAQGLDSPTRDRNIFDSSEWELRNWLAFHRACKDWSSIARNAVTSYDKMLAIAEWQKLLGTQWFPASPG